MTLAELGLTPSQLAELEELDATLVDAWLVALEHAHGLRSPVGWFLAGVRSGSHPGAVSDNDRAQAVRLAERYLASAGMFLPSEAELVDELFGQRGRLKPWIGDDALVARMVAAWRARQPATAQVDAEALERAGTWRKAHAPRHDLGTTRTSVDDTTQTAQPSHSSVPLTRVSAPPALVGAGVDADIAW